MEKDILLKGADGRVVSQTVGYGVSAKTGKSVLSQPHKSTKTVMRTVDGVLQSVKVPYVAGNRREIIGIIDMNISRA